MTLAVRPSRAAALTLALFAVTAPSPARAARADATTLAAVEFNMGFLHGDGPPLDGSRFAYGNPVQPGLHSLMLYLNGQRAGRVTIRLAAVAGHSPLPEPCFDRALLQRLGVDLSRLTATAAAALASADARCHPLDTLVEGATAHYDMSDFRLDVGIPQAALARHARGYIDPANWDDGVPAAILRYDASVYGTRAAYASAAGTATRAYLGLRAGINAGPWRLRHAGNLSAGMGSGARGGVAYLPTQTYVQRAIVPLDSLLMLGDGFTEGTLFDSVGFRGVQMTSDDRMLPESRRGFAPIVRGIAHSNARVQIRQGGNLLYETTVAPGAFEIDDLYPTGYGGDLDVITTEADGSVRAWRVPFAATVKALRPGVTRFSLTAGQYRQPSIDGTPWLAQATVRHGLNNVVTLEGGVMASRDYTAIAGGIVLNTAYGAFAADVVRTFTESAQTPDRSGQRVRLAYHRLFPATGTSVSVSGYQPVGTGYLSLSDAVTLRHVLAGDQVLARRPVRRAQVVIHQPLGDRFGTFYLSGAVQAHRGRGGFNTQFQIGYAHTFGRLRYSISAARAFSVDAGRWDNRVMLTLGLPLGNGANAPYAATALTYDPRGHLTAQQSLTGTAGNDNTLAYGLSASASRAADGTVPREAMGISANATYLATMATVNGNAGVSSDHRQAGGGISGVIVGYAGGVAISPAQGDTLAVVEADDAPGARIVTASGTRVGPWGRAVVSNLQPFARNAIEIDPRGLPLSMELKEDTHHVVPTAGAVVRARFDTRQTGRPALIRARMADGQPLPFGAEVFAADGRQLGTVAQGGRILVRGLAEHAGALTVTWGSASHQRCTLHIVMTGGSSDLPLGEGQCSASL